MNMEIRNEIDNRDKKMIETKKEMQNINSIFETQNKQLVEVLSKYR